MSNRIMLDGIGSDARAITDAIGAGRKWLGVTAVMGAGYVDGQISRWIAPQWDALTRVAQSVVRITVAGDESADVADCENGDLTPAAAAAWAKARQGAGRPVIYTNRSNKPAVVAECKTLGLVPGPGLGLWVATLDGTFTDLDGSDLRKQAGVVGVQFLADTSPRAAGPWDVSLVVDGTWMVSAAPGSQHVAWAKARVAEAQAGVAAVQGQLAGMAHSLDRAAANLEAL